MQITKIVSLIGCDGVRACAGLCNTLRQTNSCHLVPPDPPARSRDRCRAMLEHGSFLKGMSSQDCPRHATAIDSFGALRVQKKYLQEDVAQITGQPRQLQLHNTHHCNFFYSLPLLTSLYSAQARAVHAGSSRCVRSQFLPSQSYITCFRLLAAIQALQQISVQQNHLEELYFISSCKPLNTIGDFHSPTILNPLRSQVCNIDQRSHFCPFLDTQKFLLS